MSRHRQFLCTRREHAIQEQPSCLFKLKSVSHLWKLFLPTEEKDMSSNYAHSVTWFLLWSFELLSKSVFVGKLFRGLLVNPSYFKIQKPKMLI